jgi:serine protease DegQ
LASSSIVHRFWLIFAQAVTVALAVLFVVTTLKPEWLGGVRLSTVVPVQQATQSASATASGGYRQAANKALPAVVHIFTSKEIPAPRHPLLDDPIFKHFFGDRFELETQRTNSLGSGVIVSPAGYILTNFHVIEAASEIEVALADSRSFRARVVGADPESDLAVLQLAPKAGTDVATLALPAITFAPADSAQIGDVVLAIGNPFGVGQTVTMGIVSALGRSHLGINTFENFIQTDAAINPGNSGGALVDTEGNLLGINTAIYSQSGGSLGIGFAIPVSSARAIMEQIIQTGSVTRGWIGVEAQEITPELADAFGLPDARGALIAGVLRGSPADTAGIRPGDILLAVGGKPVDDPQAMLESIAALKPGDTVPFSIRRDNATREQPVRIGKRPPIRSR